MHGFSVTISCCVKILNIPNKFVKYSNVPLFKAATLVAYGPAIKWVKISIKEMDFDGNYMVPSEDYSLRISMENMRLRDDLQREEQIRGRHPVSLRG